MPRAVEEARDELHARATRAEAGADSRRAELARACAGLGGAATQGMTPAEEPVGPRRCAAGSPRPRSGGDTYDTVTAQRAPSDLARRPPRGPDVSWGPGEGELLTVEVEMLDRIAVEAGPSHHVREERIPAARVGHRPPQLGFAVRGQAALQ